MYVCMYGDSASVSCPFRESLAVTRSALFGRNSNDRMPESRLSRVDNYWHTCWPFPLDSVLINTSLNLEFLIGLRSSLNLSVNISR
jgi:hypothetical protein